MRTNLIQWKLIQCLLCKLWTKDLFENWFDWCKMVESPFVTWCPCQYLPPQPLVVERLKFTIRFVQIKHKEIVLAYEVLTQNNIWFLTFFVIVVAYPHVLCLSFPVGAKPAPTKLALHVCFFNSFFALFSKLKAHTERSY